MAKIIRSCPQCNKLAEEKSRLDLGAMTLITFDCGHTITEQNLSNILQGRFNRWRDDEKVCTSALCPKAPHTTGFWFPQGNVHLRQHQIENLQHFITSGGRHQIQDETGLGKTESALAELILMPELLPCVILCRGALPYQWQKRIHKYTGKIPQVITSSKEKPLLNFFNIIIVSLDKLKRVDWLKDNSFNSVIIDEIQLIKNHGSKRTNAVRELCREKKYITQLSGTPIENSAAEYFPSLNILWPERFYDQKRFIENRCKYYWNGYTHKIGGLRDPEGFFDETRRIIIRHKMKDVEGMPEVQRDFKIVEIADAVKEAYGKAEEDFLEAFQKMESGEGNKAEASLNLAAQMQILRHITGLAKVPACLDFITDYLFTCDRKIAIYCHHNDVGEMLKTQLEALCKDGGLEAPVSLLGSSPEERARLIRPFTEGTSRILLAKLLSSGEGLDLNMCSDYVILERHWNPKKEEQVEGRGARLSSAFKTVFVSYLVGIGTIDEFMAELNERKREAVDEALDGEAMAWDETSVMMQIGMWLAGKKKKAWRLK